jgi:hypothetical protein
LEGEPKTKKGKRRVDLPAIAVEAFEDHRKRMLAEGHASARYVFCDWAGGPLRRQERATPVVPPDREGRGADFSLPACTGSELRLPRFLAILCNSLQRLANLAAFAKVLEI